MKQAFGIAVPETLAEICSPSSCALLIYDMQVGIVPQISEGQEILDRCKQLLDAARGAGFRIFFTRHFYLPNRAAGSGQLRRAMVWQRKDDPADTTPFHSAGLEALGNRSRTRPARRRSNYRQNHDVSF
jgi:nicotinamidase-related amidase